MTDITGIYFRVQRRGEWLNIDVADLTEKEIRIILIGKSDEWKASMIYALARQIKAQAADHGRYYRQVCSNGLLK